MRFRQTSKKNNNNKRERKIRGEGNQPVVVTPGVTSPKLSVSVEHKLRKMEEASDI